MCTSNRSLWSVPRGRWLLWMGVFVFLTPTLAVGARPCKKAAPGMVCIAGAAIKRLDKKRRSAKTYNATVETFYIDKHEVSNKDYARCVKERGCYRPYGWRNKARLNRPNQPATNVSWYDAVRYCTWAGKRLPTEAEWERAARSSQSDLYPWGATKGTCKDAHYSGCRPRRPKDVDKGKAHAHGLYHMAGNAMEWVADWHSPCIEGCKRSCGKACYGANPKGVCGGGLDCTKAWRRVVKGGSWLHNRSRLSVYWRSGINPRTRGAAVGFRCASSTAVLKIPTDYVHRQKRATLPLPTGPLSAAQQKIFTGFPVDNLKTKKPCKVGGRSYSFCRDPNHYVLSNERRQFLWRPFLQNLGGAHVGIGADQNYNFIAWSRSRVAWLMDYDHVIVWIHQLHRAFILKSPSATKYLTFWTKKNAKKSLKLLKETYKNDRYRRQILRAYVVYRRKIQGSLLRDQRIHKRDPKSIKLKHYWLYNPKHYKYIYTMYKYDRIRIMPGDLLKHNSLKGSALAAKKMGLKVRTCYLSNAEEVWLFPKTYRTYFRYMPFDGKSILIRTGSLRRWGTKKYGWFHYNLQGAIDYQRKINARAMRGYSYKGFRFNGAKVLMEFFRHRSPIREDLTLINLPRTYRRSH